MLSLAIMLSLSLAMAIKKSGGEYKYATRLLNAIIMVFIAWAIKTMMIKFKATKNPAFAGLLVAGLPGLFGNIGNKITEIIHKTFKPGICLNIKQHPVA